MARASFSHSCLLCLSLAQGFCAAWGNRNPSGSSFRIFAVWNLLDCVGALHAVVPSCETTNQAVGAGCRRGKCCGTYVLSLSLDCVLVRPSPGRTTLHLLLELASSVLLRCSCSLKDFAEGGEKQKLHLADTLLDLLSVLVEFWCQQNCKLNQNLVEKGLKDLAEHFAVISQGR